MSKITVTLSSANMGDVDETDFDLWARYVADNIEDATGIECQIEQHRYGEGEDEIEAYGEERETLRRWLSTDGWNAFCGEAWETMRAEHDAAA